MLDVTVIILTYNEEIHIRRCIENVRPIAREIYVVDCKSTDNTAAIVQELGAKVVEHEWPGNQAEQFNWALQNIPISTEWILRMDADEYLTDELIEEMKEKLPTMKMDVSAILLPLGRAFMGRVLKHGIVNGVKIVRLFRRGKVRYEQRIMDEHLQVLEGKTIAFEHKFIDDNRLSIKDFTDKHNNYSSREAVLLLDAEYGIIDHSSENFSAEYSKDVQNKRSQKQRYARMPLFWRAFAYFCYRYFFKLGFLDGKEGFMWDFLQGWWYRTLVDAKVWEIKRACKNDPVKMKEYIHTYYNITLR